MKGYFLIATVTDGRQCARARERAEYSEEDVDVSLLIPDAELSLILKLLEKAREKVVTLCVGDGRAEVRAEAGRVRWEPPHGPFPPCDQLFAGFPDSGFPKAANFVLIAHTDSSGPRWLARIPRPNAARNPRGETSRGLRHAAEVLHREGLEREQARNEIKNRLPEHLRHKATRQQIKRALDHVYGVRAINP